MEPNSEPPDENLDIDPEILNRAREGNSFAQLDVGKHCYFTVAQYVNMERAFHWFTLSAKQGNLEAQFRLGDMYALGQGTEKNEFIAYDWYLKSAIQGYPKALTRIHNLYHTEKSIYCRGQRDSKEADWADADFKKENGIREIYEHRVQQLGSELTNTIQYFTKLLETCRKQIDDVDEENKQHAYLKLGFLYQHGYGIRKIKTRAIEFYTLAAEKGNIDAAYNLAHIYHHTLKMKWNYREAFKWYTKATENGHIYAHDGLAFMYLKGLGTSIDHSKAIDLYTIAAENRNVNAMVSLAKIFRKGETVEQDYAQASEWYKKAIMEGSTVAQNSLELLIDNQHLPVSEIESHLMDEPKKVYSKKGLISRLRSDISILGEAVGLEKLKKVALNAMKGDGHAMLDIGMKYYNGDEFDQDNDVAFKWIKNAAKSGTTTIQSAIAKLYKDGVAVEQNYHKASIWYDKAAKKGDTEARYNLGSLYHHGLGVRKDTLEASRWYTFAAEKNNSDAQCQLGIFRETGEGLRQDVPEALKWFIASVKQKNPEGVYRLAQMYENGTAGKSSFKLALILYEKAAQLGDLDSQLRLAKIYDKDENQYHNKNTAFKYYEMASKQDSPEAKYKLAIMYLDGRGVSEDFIQAYRLFKESSNLGYDNASDIFNIPIDYSKTRDINYYKVIDMFESVSEDGADSLEYNLGHIYSRDATFIHDNRSYTIRARTYPKEKWFKVAAEKNVPGAHHELAVIYEEKNDLPKAVKYYKSAHELGDIESTYKLASMYLDNRGVSQDFHKAFLLFNDASDKGHKEARKILNIFEHNHQNREIYLIKKMYQASAESGNIISQYKLGMLALAEKAPKYKIQDVIKWLSMSSEGGFVEASFMMGLFYEENAGMEKDYQEIIRLYELAANKGHKMALFRLAQIYHTCDKIERDHSKAYDYYAMVAQQGYQPAQLAINITTESIWKNNRNRLNNVSEKFQLDYGSCILMWESVAERGDPEVQYKLGVVYEKNEGDPNMAQAAKWYSKAAHNSHIEALYRLGRLYETGQGVSQDYTTAIRLYERASDLNNDQALYQLGVIYHYGREVKPDFEKAYAYYMKSAKYGNSTAQFILGRLHEEGTLLPQNKLEALKWYSRSASQGNENAENWLTAYYDEPPDNDLFYDRKRKLLSQIIHRCHQAYQQDNSLLGSVNYKLGNMYYYGHGTPVDYREAWKYYCESSKFYGDNKVREILTVKYENIDASIEHEYLKKIEMVQKVIDQLSDEDIYELGCIYHHGVYTRSTEIRTNTAREIIPPDHHKSSKYFRMITKREYTDGDDYYLDCSYYLGMIYFIDSMYTNDSSKAQYYLENAFKSGSSDAHDFLDYINDRNSHIIDEAKLLEKAFRWHHENLHTNNTKLTYNLGWMHAEGLGTQKDYNQAIDNYWAAAEKKYTLAYLKLGQIYSNENEGKLDHTRAAYWYTQAAKQGHIAANYILGNIYYNGKGVAKDLEIAFKYYKIAADQGHSDSQCQIGLCYMYGHGTKQIYAEAIEWLKKAAEQKNVNANYILGNLYFDGEGFEKDYDLAYLYYRAAADEGHKDSKLQLDRILILLMKKTETK